MKILEKSHSIREKRFGKDSKDTVQLPQERQKKGQKGVKKKYFTHKKKEDPKHKRHHSMDKPSVRRYFTGNIIRRREASEGPSMKNVRDELYESNHRRTIEEEWRRRNGYNETLAQKANETT